MTLTPPTTQSTQSTQTPPALPLQVDIVSDVVCPWCIIGYKQLMKALAALPGQFDVTLRWHPFELNPGMPMAGQDLREHLAQKYGTTPEQSQGARARLSALGGSPPWRVRMPIWLVTRRIWA